MINNKVKDIMNLNIGRSQCVGSLDLALNKWETSYA
jgi:hypothetical protein